MKLKFKLILVGITLQACITQKQNQGSINPVNGDSSIDFITQRGVIVIPVLFEDKQMNFLFDNGDDLTTINRKTQKGKTTKISTSSGESAKLGQEKVASLKIGNFDFQKINARNQNLDFIEKDVPNLGGLIGQSVISKANWLIDFSKNKMIISTSPLRPNVLDIIELKNMREPKIKLTYNGVEYTAFVDLGSSTALSVTQDSPLAIALRKQFEFKKNIREVATAGGLRTLHENIGVVSDLKIGSVKFDEIQTSIRETSSQSVRIGASFFKDKTLIISNSKDS